jgi:hypothetical protein
VASNFSNILPKGGNVEMLRLFLSKIEPLFLNNGVTVASLNSSGIVFVTI